MFQRVWLFPFFLLGYLFDFQRVKMSEKKRFCFNKLVRDRVPDRLKEIGISYYEGDMKQAKMRTWLCIFLLLPFAVFAESDPYQLADRWLREEYGETPSHWSAFAVLSTSTRSGELHSRVMGMDTLTTFYTSSRSQKVADLREHPYAAVTIWLSKTKRQISYHGPVRPVQAEDYWSRYPLSSKRTFIELEEGQPPTGESVEMPSYFVGYKIYPKTFTFFEIPDEGLPRTLYTETD